MPQRVKKAPSRIALMILLCLTLATVPMGLGEVSDSGKVLAAGCPTIANTPSFSFAYGLVQLDGASAAIGTVVEAWSPRGDVVGCFEVTSSGAYGSMYVYGEDTSISPPLPGMRDGEVVAFYVDGVLASASPELNWHNDRDLHQVDLDAQTPIPLDAPSNLSATAISQSEIRVSWQDNSAGESAFYVERSTDGGQNWTQAGSTGTGVTAFDDTGQSCNSTYHYRVRAFRDSDASFSGYSNVDSATTDLCGSGGLDIMVSQSTDDAEEKLTDGDMALKSVDLELGEDSVPQLVGLRFQNIEIPPGASISSASIVFSADETHSDDTDLVFHGQDSDDAATFGRADGDISARSQTAASVAWNNVGPWSTIHDTYQSPDLSPIIQEIVNRPGWQAGNSLAILIDGSGKRTAESYNGEPDMAPRLLVEYGAGPPPTCFTLTLGHSGSGSDPVPSPANSAGCAGGQYVAGQVVNLSASPASGWAVASWSGTDNDASTSTSNQVTMPSANHSAGVNYVEQQVDCYALTLSHTGSGGDPVPSPANSAGCAGGQYVAGQVVSLSASPASGWAVASWSGTDNDASISTSNQVTMPSAAHAAAVAYAEAPPGDSVEVRVADSKDDAEEKLTDGDMALKSVDLELGEDSVPQLVGLRFQNVEIPQGASISSASIVFSADETHDGDTDLVLRGQDSDDTGEFASGDGNISSRPQTSASVPWNNVVPWTTVHANYATPDLSPIIQEIVSRPGWSSGNSLVILIEGSGKRTAESYNGEPDMAPQLLVDYGSGQPPTCYTLSLDHTGSGSDPAPSPANSAGCAGGQYVAGQVIDLSASPDSGWAVASWSGTDNNASTSISNQVTMPAANHTAGVNYVEMQVDCYALTLSHTGSGSDPAPSPANSAGCAGGQYVAGQVVDLSASPDSGWAVASWSGTDDDGSTATNNQVTMPSAAHAAGVDYTEAPPGGSVEIRIGTSTDDAEERLTDGDMALKGVDLELGEDGTAQLVGVRFQNVDIPQGASITSASIIFTADESHDGDTDVVLRGQDSDDALTFGSADYDVTSRPQTTASVSWTNVEPWNTVHATYASPDISPIIQEIVSRSGWASGNNLVVFVEGSGRRTAEAYNGEPTMAPVLHVTYSGP